MIDLIKKVIIINLVAALVVFVLSNYISFFKTTAISDFLFFIVVVIWLLAKLFWDGGENRKTSELTDTVLSGGSSDHVQQNYQTGLVLFIAGLPAFIGLLIMQYLF